MAVNKGKEVAASNTTSGGKRRKSMCSRPESSGKGAKRRRQDVLKFVDDTAMEDEDDSDGMSFIDDLVDDDGEELDQGHTRDVKLGLKHTKSSSRLHHPLFLKEENMSIEEHEALIKERYSRHVTYEDEKEHINEIYLYTSKDPSIWKVNCMIGREQRIAFSLFQKYIDLQNFGNKLPIISVFAPEHVKGCVYIEAEKEADVTEACKGFYVLYNKKTSVTKDEIPGLLSVKTALNRLSEGTWVRVKSGNYKGDLAQVVAFDDQHKRAMVKLIPRIDLQALSKKFGGGVSLKESGIPKPRLISSWELEDFRPHIQIRCDRLTGENFEVLDGMMLKEGYVYKKVSVASLNWLGVQPSRNELMKFEAAKMDDAEDLNWLSLVNGERKKVCLEGSNVGLENNEGNHYQLNDLVLFGQKEFGVIISIKGDSIQILKGDTERTQLATVLRKYIRTTCVDKMFTASDCHKKNIAINDIVKVLEGPSEGREGTVKHMYKGTLFIYDETQTENCGFFCAKSQSCLNIKQLKSFKRDKKGSTSSYVDADEPMTTGEPSESRDFNGARRSRPINFVSPFSVGQTVRIRAGPLKGYLCRVTSIYRSKAIVKLDSLVKVLTVNLTDLSEVNTKNFGSSIRDTSSMISSDQFGSQDRPTDNGMAAPSGNNAWDSIAPANGRDSWPSCSTSMVAVPCHNADDERDNPQGADPWSSTLRSKDSEQSKDMDCWGKALSSSGQISAWNSSASVKEPTDSWEKGITRKEDDVLGKALASQYENISVANSGAWEENPGNANSGSSKNSMDAWNVKGKSTTANEGDGWGKSSFSPNKKDAQYNSRGWGNSVSSGNDQRSSWEKRADNREKANAEGDWHSNWNAWNVQDKSITANEGDGWGKASFSPNKKDAHDNSRGWGNSVSSGNDQRSSWEKRADNREQANAEGDWHGNWNAWNVKGKSTTANEGDGWGKASFSPNKKDAQDNSRVWGNSVSSGNDQRSSWEKRADNREQANAEGDWHGNWNAWNVKGKSTTANEGDGWGKASFSPNKKDAQDNRRVWGNSVSSGNDQRSSWEKRADNREQANAEGDWHSNWNKPSQFGGWGHGQGRGRGKSLDYSERSGGADEQRNGWGRGKSIACDMSTSEQQKEFNRNKGSDWNNERQGVDEACGVAKQPSGWNNEERRNWNEAKNASFDQSGWSQGAAANETSSAKDNWEAPKPCGNQSSWNDDGSTWNKPKKHSLAVENTNTETVTDTVKRAKWSDDGKGWGNSADKSSCWAKSVTKTTDNDGSWTKLKVSGDVGKEENGNGNNWDRSKSYSDTKNTGWNDDGRSWSKPKESDGNNSHCWNSSGVRSENWNQGCQSSEWSRNCGDGRGGFDSGDCGGRSRNWNRGGRSFDRGESSEWNGNRGRSRGRGRNFNRFIGNQQNSHGRRELGGWRKDEFSSWNQGEQTSGGFQGSSGQGRGWSTDKGILETPKIKTDWQSSTCGSTSTDKEAGTGTWNQKPEGGWIRKGDETEKRSWAPPRPGAEFAGKDTTGWNAGPESSMNANTGKSCGWDKSNAPEKELWGPPRTWADRQTTWWEKGSADTWERGWEVKSSSREEGDSGNWNRNAGQKIWDQEKTQPSGSNSHGNAWGSSSGSWEKPRDGNGMQTTCWEKGSGSFMDSDTRNRGWEARSSSRGADDTTNWNRNAGQKTWNQEKTHPIGSNTSWEKPKDGNRMQTTGLEKGSGSSTDVDNWERGWEVKSSSREVGDSSNWNRNAGQKIWNQEKTQPSGSNPHGNKGHAWESLSGIWEKPKDGNGMKTTGWEKGSGSSMDADTRERGWEAKSSSREAGDSGNWNGNGGQKIWNQEKTQPSGSNTHGNKRNVWESSSGSWEKPKDGNGSNVGKGGW